METLPTAGPSRSPLAPPKGVNRRRALGILLGGALILGGVGFWALEHSDARHERFYQAGRSINSFLSAYCQSFREAPAGDRGRSLLPFYSEPAAGRDRRRWVPREPQGPVGLWDLQAAASAPLSAEDLEAELAQHLEGLEIVEKAQCKIGLIEHLGDKGSAVLTVRQVLDSRDAAGRAFQDQILLRWGLEPTSNGVQQLGWSIASDEMVRGIRVVQEGSTLVELEPEALGLTYRHQRDPRLDKKSPQKPLRFAVAEHASGGLSAADYDLDGRPDLFFPDGVESRLFRNLGVDADDLSQTLRFEDVTDAAGLSGIGSAQAAAFADFDNDGDRDLFVGRYLAPSRFYRNLGDGTFQDESEAAGLASWQEPITGITLLDYDGDGFVDVYLGINGQPFEEVPRLPFFARNGRPNRLLRNLRGQGFSDETEGSGTGDTGWALAVAAGDYDGDGDPDLAVANDFGRKALYRNNGDGTFTERAKEAGVLDIGAGMGVAWGDMDGDGRTDLYTSNIASNQRWFGEEQTANQYLRNVLRSRWFLSDFREYRELYRLIGDGWLDLGRQIGEGNSLFRNRGDGTFEELRDSRAERAGWGWGVAFFDLENDSDLDLYAANGWISNTPDTDL